MNDTPKDRDQWERCPPGELQRLVHRVRTRQRRQVLKRLAGVGAALVLIGAGGYVAGQWWHQPTEHHFGGIACSEVMRLLPDYRANKLDAELARRISIHLEKCPNCGPAYRRATSAKAGTAHVHHADAREGSLHGRTVLSGNRHVQSREHWSS
jgi:hypothetical protein